MIKTSVTTANIKRFKSMLMKFLSVQERSLSSIHDLTSVKLLTRLRLKFSYLNEHKSSHNIKDTVVAMCDWNRNGNNRTLFLALNLFCNWKIKTPYDKHFSSQNLNEASKIFFYTDAIGSINVTRKKFFFIQLIILDLINVLKNH